MDSLRVKTVPGLVQQQRVRVAEESRCDAEPLTHAERELAGALASDRCQSDHLDQIVDAPARDAVSASKSEKMLAGGSAGVQ